MGINAMNNKIYCTNWFDGFRHNDIRLTSFTCRWCAFLM